MNPDVFTMPVADSERGRRYIHTFDRAVEDMLRGFDVDTGLIHHEIPEGSPGVPPEVADINRHERREYISPLNKWGYGIGRGSSSIIGALGYAYAQPLSRYHGDPGILRAICNGFDAFRRNQAESGEFVFTPLRFSSIYGTHEMAWRLECFITAYFCIREALDDEQADPYWRFLLRAMKFLQNTPCDHPCNRGMSWVAVMAMCWRATGDESFLADAREMWRDIHRFIFQESGQINEGHGPCNNYSPVTYQYLVRYRMMSGDESLDPLIRMTTDWMAEMHTDTQFPFQGVSTRYDRKGPTGKSSLILGGYELFAHDVGWYASSADDLLTQVSRTTPQAAVSHGGISWITAAWLHNPATVSSQATKRPPYINKYEDTSHRYFTLGTDYWQAITAMRGSRRRKGLQTWAVRGHTPFIMPDPDGAASSVLSYGFDLKSCDITANEPTEIVTGDVPALIAKHDQLTVVYLVTPASLVVVHSFPEPTQHECVWGALKQAITGYHLDGECVRADGTAGSLWWWGDAPTLSDNGMRIVFSGENRTQVYAFTAGTFEKVGEISNGDVVKLEWHDESGRYAVDLDLSSDRIVTATVADMA
jgi:hypothetical protein